VVLKRTVFIFRRRRRRRWRWSCEYSVDRRSSAVRRSNLAAETVQSAALSLQGVYDVHGGDGLPFGVLGVSDGVSDDVLEEYFQYAARFFVNQTGDTFDAASTSQSSDRRFRDALDVVTENLTMTFGATFSQSLASFTATGHY